MEKICAKEKMPRAILAFAASLAILILLSGCLEVRTTQYFYPNGRSHVVQQIGVGGLLTVLNSSGFPYMNSTEPGAWENAFETACLEVQKAEKGAMCHRSGSWFMLDQDRVIGADYSFDSYPDFPYTVYDLRIFRPPQIPSDLLRNNSMLPVKYGAGFFANTSKSDAAALSKAGVKYTYFIRMPGEVYSASHGTVTSDGVELDVLSQYSSGEFVRIKSREYDWGQLSVGIIFGLDVLLLLDVAAIFGVAWIKRNSDKIERMRAEAKAREDEARAAERRKKLTGYKVYSMEEEGSVSKLGFENEGEKGKKKKQ